VKRIRRGGGYLRVADPDWDDPLDGSYSRARGGRWNSPGSFPVVYLNRDEGVARANLNRKYEDLPYGPEDIDSDSGPDLVETAVPDSDYGDVVTDEGCAAVDLPTSYPYEADGEPIPQERCWPIGQAAWDDDDRGIACRSAAREAPAGGEELAYFDRGERLPLTSRVRFLDWY
jgi:hypothetical protein